MTTASPDRNGPIKLRGHHFLCLLTYKGLGYTPAFVDNLSAVANDINAGHPVILSEGPDDICKGLSAEDRIACGHDCAKPQTRDIDGLAIQAVAPLLCVAMDEPFILTSERIIMLRTEFSKGSIRSACQSCQWMEICDQIADSDYAGVKLFPGR
jgi:uncharacterized protein